jgi:hypothetical protein
MHGHSNIKISSNFPVPSAFKLFANFQKITIKYTRIPRNINYADEDNHISVLYEVSASLCLRKYFLQYVCTLHVRRAGSNVIALILKE